ncbi:hypothetical protein HS088_TW21G01503 [Tripterygium wilfordii]|uniref:NAC domain-containing protein n=1 Tax=Tripterygium wilfordii TaxID=458696 RepID=A0A7J7C5E1_TRIWF|nr:hypothetical protein HS088_TW21G01503 [Tripterygium wilfordii]
MSNTSRVPRKLAPGFHFQPTKQELILQYLQKKVKGLPLPPLNTIIECDLYDKEERWRNVFEQDRSSKIRYFFTKLEKKTGKSSRCNRETGYGVWKGQKHSRVYDKKRFIGKDGLFTYKAKKGTQGNNDNWVMHEHSLGDSLLGNDYVVCRVENKNEEGIVLAKHNPHRELRNIDNAGIHDTNPAIPAAVTLEVQSNNIQFTEIE